MNASFTLSESHAIAITPYVRSDETNWLIWFSGVHFLSLQANRKFPNLFPGCLHAHMFSQCSFLTKVHWKMQRQQTQLPFKQLLRQRHARWFQLYHGIKRHRVPAKCNVCEWAKWQNNRKHLANFRSTLGLPIRFSFGDLSKSDLVKWYRCSFRWRFVVINTFVW